MPFEPYIVSKFHGNSSTEFPEFLTQRISLILKAGLLCWVLVIFFKPSINTSQHLYLSSFLNTNKQFQGKFWSFRTRAAALWLQAEVTAPARLEIKPSWHWTGKGRQREQQELFQSQGKAASWTLKHSPPAFQKMKSLQQNRTKRKDKGDKHQQAEPVSQFNPSPAEILKEQFGHHRENLVGAAQPDHPSTACGTIPPPPEPQQLLRCHFLLKMRLKLSKRMGKISSECGNVRMRPGEIPGVTEHTPASDTHIPQPTPGHCLAHSCWSQASKSETWLEKLFKVLLSAFPHVLKSFSEEKGLKNHEEALNTKHCLYLELQIIHFTFRTVHSLWRYST